jgi:hypothetical protein
VRVPSVIRDVVLLEMLNTTELETVESDATMTAAVPETVSVGCTMTMSSRNVIARRSWLALST